VTRERRSGWHSEIVVCQKISGLRPSVAAQNADRSAVDRVAGSIHTISAHYSRSVASLTESVANGRKPLKAQRSAL
jgi:hypothetical protein